MMSAIHSSLVRRLAFSLTLAAASSTALAQDKSTTSAKPQATANRPSIYDESASTDAQIEKAKQLARHDDKRILVMFGGDWCGWCHKLHGLFATDPAIRKTLSNEYVLVMVDTKANGADTLFGRCKAALSGDEAQKAIGYPFLAVLDSDGKVVTAQRTDPLEEGDHHHPGRVNDFLTKWTVTPKDAEVVFRDGLARAQFRRQACVSHVQRTLVRLVPQARRLDGPARGRRNSRPRIRDRPR